jgi:hypothetical protein
VLSLDSTSDVFSGTGLSGTSLQDYRPVWFFPLGAAFISLLVELGIRLQFFPRVLKWLTSR